MRWIKRNGSVVKTLSIPFHSELIAFRRECFKTPGKAATHYKIKCWLWHQYESGRRPLPKWLEEELQKHREANS